MDPKYERTEKPTIMDDRRDRDKIEILQNSLEKPNSIHVIFPESGSKLSPKTLKKIFYMLRRVKMSICIQIIS